ncbi:hypothetical protein AAFC00_001375 [Neodothiora populina]|uniref:SET domain-containing protein n=1 Tax=Neodothiora populina TaxID=2781224 RepID=A0ABR3PNP2_9PEZI
MSSPDDSTLQGVEEALEQLNIASCSYNDHDVKRVQLVPRNSSSEGESSQDACNAYAQKFVWLVRDPFLGDKESTESCEQFSQVTNVELNRRLCTLEGLLSLLEEHPYSIELYSRIASAYKDCGYYDLAAGSAYKALLLIDNLDDEDAEFYDPTFISLAESISRESIPSRCQMLNDYPDLQKSLFHPECIHKDGNGTPIFPITEGEVSAWAKKKYARDIYKLLALCLHVCGCERSAAEYCMRGLEIFSGDHALQEILASIKSSVEDRSDSDSQLSIDQYPDNGMVRRECYPWNTHEPDRCSDESLQFLNAEMEKIAPKLVVKATELPALAGQEGTSRQLGVFAKEDLMPGEIVLQERSLLTANNRLQDALCDACSADLPEMTDAAFAEVVDCPECSVVFCNETCYDMACEEYHPAICDRGVEDTAKNVPPTEAANTLYTLLLLRALAMAETQEIHPLDLKYVKYIWGDYHFEDLSSVWSEIETQPSDTMHSQFPLTLPFSFQANVVLPFNMLEMMDIDIFRNPQYDVWVFNTLYAKFRGTASARLSGLSGRPIRGPEVSAVHPNWCLANHSCDPNVTWNWSSEVKFSVLKERAAWNVVTQGEPQRSQPGLKAGEEVLSHYCDINLPVNDRREWAAGSLGGACLCDRCCAEAAQVTTTTEEK